MNGGRWGQDGPPPEAYSRVTNPERFLPLHAAAADLLQRLEAEYDVRRSERYGVDAELERTELVQPVVRLEPADPDSAPLAVAFTTLPGLVVRCGRWLIEPFPVCACDACDATAEVQAENFTVLIDDVVRGGFRERMTIPLIGAAWYEADRWGPAGRSGRGSRVERARARTLVGRGPRSFEWKPWPVRLHDSSNVPAGDVDS